MIVSLISQERLFSTTLPKKVSGRYWICDEDDNGRKRSLLGIEAVNGEWLVKSNSLVDILNEEKQPVANTLIKPHDCFHLKLKENGRGLLLFAEPVTGDRQSYQKLLVRDACELMIGRKADNQISYQNGFVSGRHARLSFDGRDWSVNDEGSTNGTFVNGRRIRSEKLEAGDCIYIMGLKIVVGNHFFAYNNPDNRITVKAQNLQKFHPQTVEAAAEVEDTGKVPEFFYCSPRFKREIVREEIKIDPPPTLQKADQVPMALMLGPAMTMGFTSLSTGVFSAVNAMQSGNVMSAVPTMVMSGGMLLGTVLWPVLTKNYEKKMRIRNEQRRQQKYMEYLERIQDDIKRSCLEQAGLMRENIISTEDCAQRVLTVSRNLWERTAGQKDFLRLKIGMGDLPLLAEIKIPEKKFTMDEDNLYDAMYSLGEKQKLLTDVPVSLSLLEYTLTGVIGKRSDCVNFARNLILQMVSLHSYTELKLMLILDEAEEEKWKSIRWVPHIWDNDRTTRYYAAGQDDVKELSVVIESQILDREGEARNKDKLLVPHYVIISASKDLADKCEAFSQLLALKERRGFSVIALYDELKYLPRETEAVVEVDGKGSRVFDKDDLSGKSVAFAAEEVDETLYDRVNSALANIQLDISSQRYTLPGMLTFLEMFDVGKIEHLNALTRWKENNPSLSLQVPIGVDTLGEPFYLDLHEKFHGPHGLVAGMTGSGKSEFIITYILSLAVSFHPDEVAFILIDYKGGGLTGAFENEEQGIRLPHLAGTITNLDGSSIKRSLISIQSELRRRQAVFNEARKTANEGTMDIYKYQQLYRNGVVPEPIPHLFIISDEFAELKAQQPEFMEQLISAARIGRSLGVHLILATQKPSGVVDDQIWSNSKFRVCLKVQEKADSMDMIKCPDAAALVNTGRFYLQVGFNELFALGQSAWSGAPYLPAETVTRNRSTSIQIVDHMGRVIRDVKPKTRRAPVTGGRKQIVSVVQYLSALAREENIQVRQLWKPPIPAFLYVDRLEEKYHYKAEEWKLNPVIGEYDDPFNQRQELLTLSLTEEGNCAVYGSSGSGKTTFLTTMLFSLIRHHDAGHLNLYIMDFGSETLRAFEKAPQTGGVVLAPEEEKAGNLFKLLNREMDSRKQLFAEYGGDYASYSRNSGKLLPQIVVVINNYAGFSENYEELEGVFSVLSRDSAKYGIYFVVTAVSTNAIRYRILQNFKRVLTMQLNDPMDYSMVVGKTEGLLPSGYKGRGLISIDRVYEFQTAYAAEREDIFAYIRSFSALLREESHTFAPPVPVLPKVVNLAYVREKVDSLACLPVGVGRKTLKLTTINLTSRYLYPVAARDNEPLAHFTQGLAEVAAATGRQTLVLDTGQEFVADALREYRYVRDSFDLAVQELFQLLVERNNTYKDSGMSEELLAQFDERVVIILGMKRLAEQLTADGADKLKALLDKGEAIYKVHFVIAENVSQYSSFSMENWYKKHINGAEGIWVGDGFADQYVIRAGKLSSDLYQEIGDSFGYVVSKGKPVLARLLTEKSAQWEEEKNE